MSVSEDFFDSSQQPLTSTPRMSSQTGLELTELQKILDDERSRNEEHRRNFLVLKTEHDKLLHGYRVLENEIQKTRNELTETKEKQKNAMQLMKKEILAKQNEIEELKTDRMPPQNIGLLKLAIQDEIEQAYRERFAMAEEETENLRAECNKLKYESAFRKSELDHAQSTHAHIQDELRLKYQAELTLLQKQNSDLQVAIDERRNEKTDEMFTKLTKESTKMQQKIRSLKEELQECHAQRESSILQFENLQRLQSKQNAENGANIRALELDNSTLKNQLERIQAELQLLREHEVELTSEIQNQQLRNNQLTSQLRETEFKTKIDVTNSKIELTKQKGEVERERDKLSSDIERLKKEIDVMRKKNQMLNTELVKQEKEVQKKIISLQEEEWNKQKRLETEKFELETRIQELERQNIDSDREHQTRISMAEEKTKLILQQKEMLDNEILNLRDKQSKDSVALVDNKEILKLQSEVKHYKEEKENAELILKELKEKIRRDFDGKDIITTVDIERERVQSERALISAQIVWEEQKSQLHNRISTLENQLSQLHSKHNDDRNRSQTRISKYRRGIIKLQNRTNLQKARIEELEAEREVLKRNVTLEEYRAVQKQLRHLQRKHGEYRNIITTSDPSATPLLPEVGTKVQKCYRMEKSLDDSRWDTKSELNRDRDLEELRERISKLDSKQKRQLMELESEKIICEELNHVSDDEKSKSE